MGVSKKTQGQSGYDYASMLFCYFSHSQIQLDFAQLCVYNQPFDTVRF